MVQELRKVGAKTVIGVTGTFGAGKSTVARLFGALGARVIDADRLAREALSDQNPVAAKVRALFGLGPGAIDRAEIARRVFEDAGLRRELERLVHPYVFERMEQEIRAAKEDTVVLDVPLLFETGLEKACDATVAVETPADTIRGRLAGKGFSKDAIESRQKAQMAGAEKRRRADFVIDNSGDEGRTRKQVEAVFQKIHHHLSKGEQ